MIEWINFISLILSALIFCYFYMLSIQPMKRKEKRGERAWKDCMILRSLAGLFEFITVVNILLWIWFPIPSLNWIIHPNIVAGIGICIAIVVPGLIIMFKGVKDAGSESLRPSKETEMYRGIYNYVRHPQSLGEFPIFVAIAFAINSWFLVLIMFIFILTYVPIMIHYEEKDLIKRFGDKYCEYRQRTGALFPKLWHKSEKTLC